VHQADPYSAQLQHFTAVLADLKAPLCSALDGLRTMQVTLAVSEAAASGQTVTLNHAATEVKA
jgi:predicted dehydrogenase